MLTHEELRKKILSNPEVKAEYDLLEKEFSLFDENMGFPKLGTPQSGVGFGARANLGIFVLRWDLAWATDLHTIAHKPNHYFSFGANF